jgi:outer membrane receptor protein involved in Fe transport
VRHRVRGQPQKLVELRGESMLFESIYACGLRRISSVLAVALVLPFTASNVLAQEETEDDEQIDEVTVTGSQIRGARINDALAVSVIDAGEIEAMGVSSGDELFDSMPEVGQNFFNEAEAHSGGVNAVRGDVGAFNMRNMGTGNTLALINGRRMVNSAGYQTEEIGGSFVPVNSANTNAIPVYGIERVEVLRDGASAIYGADAVAGVINQVLKSDFEGFNVRVRMDDYETISRQDERLNVEWGKFFNNGQTNVGVFFDYYHRDRVNAQDDGKWGDSNYSRFVDPQWVSEFGTNYSSNSLFPQLEFELISSSEAGRLLDVYGADVETLSSSGRRNLGVRDLTDGSYEFVTFPAGDERCEWDIVPGVICGAPDQGNYLYNPNTFRDVSGDLDRYNLFLYVNHEFDNGVESFTELSWYEADSNFNADASYLSIGASDLVVGPEYYWNPFGVCGSDNRLDDDLGDGTNIPCTGASLEVDNYRALDAPRVSVTENNIYRILQGFRGSVGDWDWETAVVWSEAERENITYNRLSNTILQQMLLSSSPTTFNIFAGAAGDAAGLAPALIDVYRIDKTDLKMIDVKFTNAELFEMPAGPVGFLAGLEYREESFSDERDPRLNGEEPYIAYEGATFPVVSDVANSSPTANNGGERDVFSAFAELALPLHETVDVQLALRYEDFSDVGDTMVGKVAFGWRPVDQLLLRGSWSEAYRVPNLITLNEDLVVRQGTRIDYLCDYVERETGANLDADCTPSLQRQASGSEDLVPEESTNTSIGLVWDATDELTFTLDYWTIEKEDSIGLFGANNHAVYDLLLRLRAGNADCDNQTFNSALVRDEVDSDDIPDYLAAGVCPGGQIDIASDSYTNLDTRTIEGVDIGIYYDTATSIGDFGFKLIGTYYDKYTQLGTSGIAKETQDALDSGELPGWIALRGYGDLLLREGNMDQKVNASVRWSKGDWGAYVSMLRLGRFYDADTAIDVNGSTLNWWLSSMTTYNVSADYDFEAWGLESRLRLGINNVADERAPLCDCRFGYWSDAHRDLGRQYYVDLKMNF